MKIINQLNAWLDRPVYEAGVLLYQAVIGPGFVLTMLKSSPDDYNRRTLQLALSQKRDELAAAHQTLTESYPEQLTESLDGGKILMDERTAIKERFRVALNSGITQGDDLKADAFRVMAIGDDLGAIYGQKDFFDRHGYLPEAASVDAEQTPAQLMQRRLTLRTYLSRETKKLNGLPVNEQPFQDTLKKLRTFQSELHDVDEQLKAMLQPHVTI